ncbi:hypothetical protein [Actinoplanes sp. NPDC026623]|uniref:hypothetical protein n=1 Tax=Actinoplanes sp. NPDC026623 TaxID=3155610 RepID=UPI003405B489
MLVAIADAALLVAAVGTVAVLLAVAATTLLCAVVAGVRMLQHRAPLLREPAVRRAHSATRDGNGGLRVAGARMAGGNG